MFFEFKDKEIAFSYNQKIFQELGIEGVTGDDQKTLDKLKIEGSTRDEVRISADFTEQFLDALVETQVMVSETTLKIFLTNLEYVGYINRTEYEYYLKHIYYRDDLPNSVQIKH